MNPDKQRRNMIRRRQKNRKKYQKKMVKHPIWNRFINGVKNTIIKLGDNNNRNKDKAMDIVKHAAQDAGIKVWITNHNNKNYDTENYRINLKFGDDQNYNSVIFIKYLMVLENIMKNYTNVDSFDTFFSINRKKNAQGFNAGECKEYTIGIEMNPRKDTTPLLLENGDYS